MPRRSRKPPDRSCRFSIVDFPLKNETRNSEFEIRELNPECRTAAETGRISNFEFRISSFLVEAQNPDGGWGYRPDAASSTEPTSWALQALFKHSAFRIQNPESRSQESEVAPALRPASHGSASEPGAASALAHPARGTGATTDRLAEAVSAGIRWLQNAQLPDGSWPAFVGQRQGCWVTSPACLALHTWAESSDRVAQGLQWLCETWPAEGNFWWRFRQRLGKRASVIRQDSSLRGWSWTPGTASWVEPTSYALIALRRIPEELHPRAASKRRQLGERMLYDRMCPGGGWNSGNALVYGVAGEPRVGPTAWALLALQDYRDRPENRESLDWLEQVYPRIRGPASLALAHLCLEAYDRPLPALEPALAELCQNNQFFRNVLVTAWAAIALSEAGVRSQESEVRSQNRRGTTSSKDFL